MSGALIQLVSKGAQDVYLTNENSERSFFKIRYARHTNFAQFPKKLEFRGQQPVANGMSSIILKSYGDLINQMWIEGLDLTNILCGTTFELYIGGQLIDTQSFEFMTQIWQVYMADTYSKSGVFRHDVTNIHFLPLHFFFCDYNLFLPLVALAYHEVEVRIHWGPNVLTNNIKGICGNYVCLDAKERAQLVSRPLEIIITQLQKIPVNIKDGMNNVFDIGAFNHPVKTIFFGIDKKSTGTNFSFDEAELQINGTTLLENMTPTYFYIAQSYYHTDNSVINMDNTFGTGTPKIQPRDTRYFMYNFCLSGTSYKPTGTCNFSRIDNAKILLTNVTSTKESGWVYAINYNVLKIQNGLGGIIFGN
jgi:hypothetical protein